MEGSIFYWHVQDRMKRFFRTRSPARFAAVGLINTGVGYAIILGIQWLTGKPVAANITGFLISSILSYLTHSHFSFGQKPTRRSILLYAVVLLIGYACNFTVLVIALRLLPRTLSQILAITAFVIVSYTGQMRLAFRRR